MLYFSRYLSNLIFQVIQFSRYLIACLFRQSLCRRFLTPRSPSLDVLARRSLRFATLTKNPAQYSVYPFGLVENKRIELLTPCVQGRCSPSWANSPYCLLIFRIPSSPFPRSSLAIARCARSSLVTLLGLRKIICAITCLFRDTLRHCFFARRSPSLDALTPHSSRSLIITKNPAQFFKTYSAEKLTYSLERRWSSRSFSNGYLVTTSPQSSVSP